MKGNTRYEHLPGYIQSLEGSSIAIATISAIIFNFIGLLAIDNFKSARVALSPDANGLKIGLDYLESLKYDWDLPLSLYEDVKVTSNKLLTLITEKQLGSDLIILDIKLTRSQLDLNLSYKGQLIKPILVHKQSDIIAENEVTIEHASNAFSYIENNLSTLHLSFDY